jgi:hypothetical protein
MSAGCGSSSGQSCEVIESWALCCVRGPRRNGGRYYGNERSSDCLSQDCLVRPAPSAAPSELAVYDDTREAPNSMLLCPCCDVRLMHVVNFDVVVCARNTPDQIHRLMTGRATSGKNLNFSPLTLGHASLSVRKTALNSRGFQQARD